MKMYRAVVGGSFGVAVFLTVLTGVLTAGEWKVGDRVVTTREAAVQVGTHTLTTIPAGTVLDITAVNGDWVSVQRDGKKITGWIDVKHLALAGQPAAPMSEQAKAATARLKTISESRNAPDLAEIGRLIEAGADVNVRNRFGVTPLMAASYLGHTEVVKLLLANKADVNAADKTGVTSLMQASQKDHAEVVKLLLANKADVNAKKKTTGTTSLWMASQDGHTEVVKLLLANNADVNIAHKTHGGTPLFMASLQGHTEIVKLLLAAGADVNAKARKAGKDYTPLSIAKKAGRTRIVELLKKHGAKE